MVSTIVMLIAMVAGILVGLLFMAARESFGGDSALWMTINKILFQDITTDSSAVGLFYIGGQLFIRALQLIIVPMVFCSVVMAISEISEASTLGRVSAKTIGWFMMTSTVALVTSGTIAMIFYKSGLFNVHIEGVAASTGSTGSNPLLVILNIVPSNIGATLSVNNAVLGVVFIAVVVGLSMNTLGLGKDGTGATFPFGLNVSGTTLKAILAEGAAYWQEGKMIIPSDEQKEITGGDVIVDGTNIADKKVDINKVRENVGMCSSISICSTT